MGICVYSIDSKKGVSLKYMNLDYFYGLDYESTLIFFI